MDIYESYYRVYAGINLDNIEHNIAKLKANVLKEDNSNVKLMAVVKTDGYGHGAIPIAKFCNENIDMYAVATVDEALNLRHHRIDKPILVLGYTHHPRYEEMVVNDIRPTIFKEEDAILLNDAAKSLGATAIIHIKLDTGMGRIGFRTSDETLEIIKRIDKLSNIKIEGVFTHFAAADSKDKTYANKQLEQFNDFVHTLKDNGVDVSIVHASNSAAIIDLKEASFDAVRAGIAMYGLAPSEEVNISQLGLKPAMEVKSHIVFVKEVMPGESISYGMTFTADKVMRVATIPVGYGDGYPRNLSGKAYVLIKGKKAQVLGRICMDQFMVDITDIPEAMDGDVVTLVGSDNGEYISIDELADMSGTLNYEFICDIGKRVPRIYYKNERIVGYKDYNID